MGNTREDRRESRESPSLLEYHTDRTMVLHTFLHPLPPLRDMALLRHFPFLWFSHLGHCFSLERYIAAAGYQ